jgi:hypothetical protein
MRTLPHIATVTSAPAEVAVFNPFNSMGGGYSVYYQSIIEI